MLNNSTLLYLLQIASSTLPIGAYSYSEGLEWLVETNQVNSSDSLKNWINQELVYGTIRVESAVMLRIIQGFDSKNYQDLKYWNDWLTAARETEELRQQSWQMGRSLAKLLIDLQPEMKDWIEVAGTPCNYAIAFGIAVAYWRIDTNSAILGYLYSWVTNLITAGVKLIPLGQTSGQKLLLSLHPNLIKTSQEILILEDDNLHSCSWGLSFSSMNHETQYTRLFRS